VTKFKKKTFFFVTYSRIYTIAFVRGKLYQPSLMFVGEARSKNVAPFGFLANTRQGCKRLLCFNILDYLGSL
jgi:hypothetical protein